MTFGSVVAPVRTMLDPAINSPDGFMSDPPGDLWWVGLHWQWTNAIPPGITRATAIIVNPLCRLPWLVVRPDGSKVAPGDRGYPVWLYDPQLLNGTSGGPWQRGGHMLDRHDRFNLWSTWLTFALWFGIGVLEYSQDSSGQPMAGQIDLRDPSRLRRTQYGWELDSEGGAVPVLENGRVDGTDRYLRLLRHSLPTGVFGRHRAQLQLANRITAYADESLNSDVPSGTLTTDMPLSQRQADAAREEWRKRQQERAIAVLGNGVKYAQTLMSPVDAEIAAMHQLSNTQIAHMFEQPAWMLDAAAPSTTYSNATDWRQDLVDGVLASWSARLEGVISALLPWGWRMQIDFTDYTTSTAPREGGDDARSSGSAGTGSTDG